MLVARDPTRHHHWRCPEMGGSALLSPSLPFPAGCHNHRYLQTRKKNKKNATNNDLLSVHFLLSDLFHCRFFLFLPSSPLLQVASGKEGLLAFGFLSGLQAVLQCLRCSGRLAGESWVCCRPVEWDDEIGEDRSGFCRRKTGFGEEGRSVAEWEEETEGKTWGKGSSGLCEEKWSCCVLEKGRGSSGEGKEMVSVWEKKMMVEPAAKLEACAGGWRGKICKTKGEGGAAALLEKKNGFRFRFFCIFSDVVKITPLLKIQCSMVFIGKVLLGFQTSPSTFPFLLFFSFL